MAKNDGKNVDKAVSEKENAEIVRMKGENIAKSVKLRSDFVCFIGVSGANPNGDPNSSSGAPRTDEGMGLISDVCLKRKIRNYMQETGHDIFLKSRELSDDGFDCFHSRYDSITSGCSTKGLKMLKMCEKCIDVRAFGATLAYKGESYSIRGPVQISMAKSVFPVRKAKLPITKSGDNESGETRGSDTMGNRYYIPHGLYRFSGKINDLHSKMTGFSDDDREILKNAIMNMFENDESSNRPPSSMRIVRMYWFDQDMEDSIRRRYRSDEIDDSIKVRLKDGVTVPSSFNDYEFIYDKLDGLEPEILK